MTIFDDWQKHADSSWPDLRDRLRAALPPEAKVFVPERFIVPGAAPKPAAPQPSSGVNEAFLAKATVHRGKRYQWGGTGNPSFDCSGLTQWAAREVGIEIGRTTYYQIHDGYEVPFSDVRIGDLVFSRFSDTDGVMETPEHVSIWAGNGKVFEAGDPIDYYNWGNRGYVRVRRIA